MTVLFLTMNPNRASTTVPTEGWLRLLPDKGLQPVLVSRQCGDFHRWAVEKGIPAYQNDLPFPDKYRPLASLKSLWSLRQIVTQHGVRLIHCNEQDVYPIGQYLGRLCRLPVVVSVHFTLPPSFASWAFRGRRQPRRMFFLSEGSMEACKPAVDGIVDPTRWRVLYNGIDLSRFQPDQGLRANFRTTHGLQDRTVIGVACALRERKQLEQLCEVASRIADPQMTVVIAGGPIHEEREYAQNLSRQAKGKLGARLLMLGHVDDLRGFYNGLDIFVNTSREEACSISVIESLACGCPVLGYPSKSVDTQILPRGGEIVAQDDVDDLERALRRWIRDKVELEKRREGAREQAQRFDIRTLSDKLWTEYKAVLSAAL